ncbi:MAG: substrate-binding domain-containing protein [Planctomycetes bacterium]|nr:substrate-binding domain-containing protein [Planctomycetota bacterium]
MQIKRFVAGSMFICALILAGCISNDEDVIRDHHERVPADIDDKSPKTCTDYMTIEQPKIEGVKLTVNNYPRVDGSPSQHSLQALVACRLLDVPYKWGKHLWDITFQILPKADDESGSESYQALKTTLHEHWIEEIFTKKGEYEAEEYIKILFEIANRFYYGREDDRERDEINYRFSEKALNKLKSKKINLNTISISTSIVIPSSIVEPYIMLKLLNEMLVIIIRRHLSMDFYIDGDTVVICTREEAMINSIPEYIAENTMHFKTHSLYLNLINNNTDMIFVARKPSEEELKLAKENGVELDIRTIAKNAFVFMVNKKNPVVKLTINQIQDIYTGKLANWKDVGGMDAQIMPYFRNQDFDHHELMKSLVMKDLKMIDRNFTNELLTESVSGIVNKLERDVNSISYSIYFYKEFMQPSRYTKLVAVDGYLPNYQNIKSGKYPLTTMVYAVTRKGMSKGSNAIKLRDWLLTPEGQMIVQESGFVPIK